MRHVDFTKFTNYVDQHGSVFSDTIKYNLTLESDYSLSNENFLNYLINKFQLNDAIDTKKGKMSHVIFQETNSQGERCKDYF